MPTLLKSPLESFLGSLLRSRSLPLSAYLGLFGVMAVIFVCTSLELNRNQIWFSNLDQDSMLLVGAMDVNAGYSPVFSEHPALGTYYTYSVLLNLFEKMGILLFSDSRQLRQYKDPIAVLPDLYYSGRFVSIIISLFCVAIFLSICLILSRNFSLSLIASGLYMFSAGLLMQSLLVRTELTSIFFFLLSLLALALCWRTENLIIFSPLTYIAGFFVGWAILSKVQAVPLIGFLICCIVYRAISWHGSLSGGYLLKIFLFSMHGAISVLCWRFLVHAYPPLTTFLTVSVAVLLMSQGMGFFCPKVATNARLQFILIGVSGILLGFLLATVVVFTAVNLDEKPKALYKVINHFFNLQGELEQRRLLKGDFAAILATSALYLKYYVLEMGMVIFFAIFASCRFRRATILGIFCLAYGFGYCFVNSIRTGGTSLNEGFRPTYLAYPDLFFVLAIVLCLWPYLRTSNMRDRWASAAKVVAAMFTIAVGFAQVKNIEETYPEYNAGLRNRIDRVSKCIYSNDRFHKMMLKYYGSEAEIICRILCDTKLNGTSEGIDIRNLKNVTKYAADVASDCCKDRGK